MILLASRDQTEHNDCDDLEYLESQGYGDDRDAIHAACASDYCDALDINAVMRSASGCLLTGTSKKSCQSGASRA